MTERLLNIQPCGSYGVPGRFDGVPGYNGDYSGQFDVAPALTPPPPEFAVFSDYYTRWDRAKETAGGS